MSKPVRKIYRVVGWFFASVIAAGTFIGCGGDGGSTKYGPPPAKPTESYNNIFHKQNMNQKDLLGSKIIFNNKENKHKV